MNYQVTSTIRDITDYECCLCDYAGLKSELYDLDGEWFCKNHGKIKVVSGNRLYVIPKSQNRREIVNDEFVIEEAALVQGKAKIAFVGPTGSGKTYTSLITAHELGEKILIIDTENRTSSKYAKVLPFPYHMISLTPPYAIDKYIRALEFAAQKGYDVVIVDSLSHAWQGEGGALEEAEQKSKELQGNKFAGWGPVTQKQNRLISTILNYPIHLIATMRMKMEYAQDVDDRGKKVVKKLGMGIVQRDSFEYEFDVIAEMDVSHFLRITKTRCYELDGFSKDKPNGQLGQIIKEWLSTGEPTKFFDNIEDLINQVCVDFNFEPDESKKAIREAGLTSLPKDDMNELHRRLSSTYTKIKQSMKNQEQSVV
jgi:hypothetical protein